MLGGGVGDGGGRHLFITTLCCAAFSSCQGNTGILIIYHGERTSISNVF